MAAEESLVLAMDDEVSSFARVLEFDGVWKDVEDEEVELEELEEEEEEERNRKGGREEMVPQGPLGLQMELSSMGND